ncbi:hypothetical protein SAMN05421858_5000 [Haladaptatus litoreus]|uniref:Uncharacterized protein n=1 Tax=Haladaptatus litoreus TaxID=553468 RepID=A0A1N7FEE6_9EURY|nr:hypothetical protein SAMN05421858_5000 [Haladaptatus litoreus]
MYETLENTGLGSRMVAIVSGILLSDWIIRIFEFELFARLLTTFVSIAICMIILDQILQRAGYSP